MDERLPTDSELTPVEPTTATTILARALPPMKIPLSEISGSLQSIAPLLVMFAPDAPPDTIDALQSLLSLVIVGTRVELVIDGTVLVAIEVA